MSGMPLPKYGTRRNHSNRTFGPRVALIADQILGTPLMPWQRMVADIALELDPHTPGAWRYDDVRITVPRQAGKTALMRAVAIDRIMSYRDHITLMTAQTGKDARKRWEQIVEGVQAEAHPKSWHTRESRGSERLQYLRSRSTLSPFPPTETGGHGDSLHLVMIDEAWSFDEAEGLALDAALNPTMLTILDSQKWTVSTKGTAKSVYLNNLIKEGREAVNDPLSRIAYFEWSANEEAAEADPYSDETLSFHPAIGHTQSADKIRRLGKSENLTTWRRSYLNLEDLTGATSPIELTLWDDLATDYIELPDPQRCTIGYDVAFDLSAASVYAAWKDGAETKVTLLATQPGHAWLTDALIRLDSKGYTRRVCDAVGPTRTLADELEHEGYQSDRLMSRDYAAACQWLITTCKTGNLQHDGNPAARAALDLTVTRQVAGSPAWSAPKSPGPIDALRALTVAAWSAAQATSTSLIL